MHPSDPAEIAEPAQRPARHLAAFLTGHKPCNQSPIAVTNPKPADLKEAFNIGLNLAPDDPRVVAGEPFRGVNLWPGYSVAFFLDPNPDAVIACLTTCVSPTRPARYEPITGAAHLIERLVRTYDFLEEK